MTTTNTINATPVTKELIKLPWMHQLATKTIEAINTSTIGRAISGLSGGLGYFARRVLPELHPELTIIYHRLYKECNMSKQLQSLLSTILGSSKVHSDWRFHLNAEVARQITTALMEREIDLIVLDGFECAADGLYDAIVTIRQELRESNARCGVLLLCRIRSGEALELGEGTDFSQRPLGFQMKIKRMQKNELASLLKHWMPWDTDLEQRFKDSDPETMAGLDVLFVHTFGEFELAEDFVECMTAIAPAAKFTKAVVEQVIHWKNQ